VTTYFTTFATELGEFSLAVDAAGRLVATAFGAAAALRGRYAVTAQLRDETRCAAARAEIQSYFAGERRTFSLPLAPVGTAFQQRVWSALQQIPFGETRTYGQLATQLGNPSASRAVGRANATNPICLVVPCHRVIGADGALTGFAFGEEIKRRLLAHERALTTHRAA
jgi:methylated-DNA-[protein]-cysteine S-methyltransferase